MKTKSIKVFQKKKKRIFQILTNNTLQTNSIDINIEYLYN